MIFNILCVLNPSAHKDALSSEFMIETVMEHIAKALNKDPTEIRKINFYQKGQVMWCLILLLSKSIAENEKKQNGKIVCFSRYVP